ncbi:unnamed protein product [Pleuronectes platessa]|uniref:Uncharacterized protein n=1 Tax=Pleuronectes platessa TaxID=8262 RepID=A0A9N7UIN4_PLEPL|nr:unnamed protein product [Pleuronectes platessa]
MAATQLGHSGIVAISSSSSCRGDPGAISAQSGPSSAGTSSVQEQGPASSGAEFGKRWCHGGRRAECPILKSWKEELGSNWWILRGPEPVPGLIACQRRS